MVNQNCEFVVLVGAVAMFDLRVLGWSRFLPVQGLGRHLLPWSVAGLMLIVPAGLMMFSTHPREFIDNRIFLVKPTLIAAAGINALLFHVGVYRISANQISHAIVHLAGSAAFFTGIRAMPG